MVTKDLAGKYHAGNIIKEWPPSWEEAAGGRPDMAQAGGQKPKAFLRRWRKSPTCCKWSLKSGKRGETRRDLTPFS